MLTTNDASDLLGAADAVVLVLRSGQTRTGPAQRVSVVLNRFRAEVLGVIFNGCDDAEMESYYGYGDAYSYAYGEAAARSSSPRSPQAVTGRPSPAGATCAFAGERRAPDGARPSARLAGAPATGRPTRSLTRRQARRSTERGAGPRRGATTWTR